MAGGKPGVVARWNARDCPATMTALSHRGGEGDTEFDKNQARSHLRAVGVWNRRRFELPDPLYFRDYLSSQHAFATDLIDLRGIRGPGRLLRFPYPNGTSKTRELSVLDPADLVILRMLAGSIASAAERRISSRVMGYRVVLPSRGAWVFESPKEAHNAYRVHARGRNGPQRWRARP